MKRMLAALLGVLIVLSASAVGETLLAGDFSGLEYLERVDEGDGAYTEWLHADEALLVTIARQKVAVGQNDTLENLLAANPNAREIETCEIEPISFYPAWRARFVVGEGEEARRNDLLYISTGEWIFLVDASIEPDQTETYAVQIEQLFSSISLCSESALEWCE